MKLKNTYYAVLAASASLYLLYWFAPWAYGLLDQERQSLLSYGGYGALWNLPDWSGWLMLLVTVIGYLGMAFFRNSFRVIFLVVFIASVLLSVVGGVSIITGPEVFLIDVSTFLAGFAIALSYFTELNGKFY